MLHFFWPNYSLRERSFEVYEWSNLEIAKWAEYYLSQYTAFHQSGVHIGRVTENPNDILLGHVTWDKSLDRETLGQLVHDWVRDNALSSKELAHPNTYILTPWVPEWPNAWTDNMPFYERQLFAASKIFALCGEFWIQKTLESTANSILTQVRNKLIHCNMGLASQNFQTYKTAFNSISERQIFHISNLQPYKGFAVTCQSLSGLETLLHVAGPIVDKQPGLVELHFCPNESFIFNYVGYVNNNDPEFQAWVVENCDFYIHTAYADAQATTILENCARGLIPLVTPESGFASPHAIYLSHDPDENREIIRWALELPEEELMNRSRALREQIAREHNWEDIFATIWHSIQDDIAAREKN